MKKLGFISCIILLLGIKVTVLGQGQRGIEAELGFGKVFMPSIGGYFNSMDRINWMTSGKVGCYFGASRKTYYYLQGGFSIQRMARSERFQTQTYGGEKYLDGSFGILDFCTGFQITGSTNPRVMAWLGLGSKFYLFADGNFWSRRWSNWGSGRTWGSLKTRVGPVMGPEIKVAFRIHRDWNRVPMVGVRGFAGIGNFCSTEHKGLFEIGLFLGIPLGKNKARWPQGIVQGGDPQKRPHPILGFN